MSIHVKHHAMVALKGLAMGAADIIPGVSGGTIAFITGIYEELIDSIRSIRPSLIGKILKGRIAEVWREINGWFLLALLAGIGTSVVSLAQLMKYLLANYDIMVWAFFFGLIIASALLVSRQMRIWNASSYLSLIAGAGIAWFITIATPAQTPTDLWFIFLSGALAICAMILPGISGAFILLLLGKYEYIVTALSELNVTVILTFVAGCALGITSFSHLLSYMFKRWHDLTVALLTGFMLGSLNKVWPWKETLSTRINSHGEEVPLLQSNVLPADFTGEPYMFAALLLCVAGFVLVAGLDFAGRKMNRG
jgi:putative membrane protein